jgi:hypothetical protein
MASARSTAQTARQIIELRTYEMHVGPAQERLHSFMEEVAMPALNEIGIGPVGVMTVMYGQNNPTLYVVLPHDSLEQFISSRERLLAQEAYYEAIDTSMSETNYIRYDSELLHAFEGMPRVEAPEADPRIFELRTYESHNVHKAERKIEMFNKGEIEIFRATNLTPVFFGKTLIGDRLPNLTYMITHENMEARNQNWEAFINHPDWEEMSADPYYADTVSNISNIVLEPTEYSQI